MTANHLAGAPRALAAACLLGAGVRVQESVFECLMDDARLERTMARLRSIALEPSDRVRVYRLCQRCANDVTVFGPVPEEKPDFYLV